MIVLITGASGGLGTVLAKTLLAKGMTVYGTMRKPEGKENEYPFPMLAMEATDTASVDQAIQRVIDKEGRIDVVVNCINEMIIGSTEEETVEEVVSLYNTNVFSVLRVCKAVLPQMRKQRGGTIINMSSLGGLLAVPYMGAYTSAKFALEALSEALYHEVKKDGISVVIMQPVAMYMDRPATGGHLHTVENVTDDSFTHKMVKVMARDTAASKLTPEIVSEKISQVINAKKKPLRVPMDKAKAISVLKRVAPQALINKLIGGLLKDAG
jgi:short-subunit dehydrogenase